MPIKIGINGMGRIGRMVVRSIYENHKDKIQIKHINNRSSSEVCMNLLKYDSVHGKFKADIKSNESNLKINNHKVSFSQFSNIQDINWKKYNVDYVFECTGKFNSKEKLNNSFSKASNSYLKNILNVTKEKLVSIDFNHNSGSAILDSSLTNVVGTKMGKISAWYDNEWGFSNRMCDIARYLSKIN